MKLHNLRTLMAMLMMLAMPVVVAADVPPTLLPTEYIIVNYSDTTTTTATISKYSANGQLFGTDNFNIPPKGQIDVTLTTPDLGHAEISTSPAVNIAALNYNYYSSPLRGVSWYPSQPNGCPLVSGYSRLSFPFVRQKADVYDIIYLTNLGASTATVQMDWKVFEGDTQPTKNTSYTITIGVRNTLSLNLGRMAGTLVPDLDRDGNPHTRDFSGSLIATANQPLQGAKVNWRLSTNAMTATEAACAPDGVYDLWFPFMRIYGDDGTSRYTVFHIRNHDSSAQTLTTYFINFQGVILSAQQTVPANGVWAIDTRAYPYSNLYTAYTPIGLDVFSTTGHISGFAYYVDEAVPYNDRAAYTGIDASGYNLLVPNLWCQGSGVQSTRIQVMWATTTPAYDTITYGIYKQDGTLQYWQNYSFGGVVDLDLCYGLPLPFNGTVRISAPRPIVATVLDRYNSGGSYIAAHQAVKLN